MELQEDLLADIYTEINQEPVSVGKRFANYLIDIVIFYILVFIAGVALASLSYQPDTIMLYLISYIVFVSYYTLIEGFTNGKSIGKMITGCKAVKVDGTPITWNDALLRSLSRIVPFEPFSTFGGHP